MTTYPADIQRRPQDLIVAVGRGEIGEQQVTAGAGKRPGQMPPARRVHPRVLMLKPCESPALTMMKVQALIVDNLKIAHDLAGRRFMDGKRQRNRAARDRAERRGQRQGIRPLPMQKPLRQRQVRRGRLVKLRFAGLRAEIIRLAADRFPIRRRIRVGGHAADRVFDIVREGREG